MCGSCRVHSTTLCTHTQETPVHMHKRQINLHCTCTLGSIHTVVLLFATVVQLLIVSAALFSVAISVAGGKSTIDHYTVPHIVLEQL
jgi:hypothetical protein